MIGLTSAHTHAAARRWNFSGQLGQGNRLNYGNASGTMGDVLPYVSLGTNLTANAVATASYATCAILASGGIKCWGCVRPMCPVR